MPTRTKRNFDIRLLLQSKEYEFIQFYYSQYAPTILNSYIKNQIETIEKLETLHKTYNTTGNDIEDLIQKEFIHTSNSR